MQCCFIVLILLRMRSLIICVFLSVIITGVIANIFRDSYALNYSAGSCQDITPDGLYMAVCTSNNQLYIYKNSGKGLKFIQQIGDFDFQLLGVQISNDGMKMFASDIHGLFFYKNDGLMFKKYQLIWRFFESSNQITKLAGSSDLMYVAAVNLGYTIFVFKYQNQKMQNIQNITILPQDANNSISSLVISSDYKFIIEASINSTDVYQLNSGVYTFKETLLDGSSYKSLDISENPSILVGARYTSSNRSYAANIYQYNQTSFELIQRLMPNGDFAAVKITTDGKQIVVGTLTGRVRVYQNFGSGFIQTAYNQYFAPTNSSYQVIALSITTPLTFMSVSYLNNKAVVYFQCNLPLCSDCSFYQLCTTCTGTSLLSNYQCSCSNGKTISNLSGLCVNCTIPNCFRCDQNDQCAQCSNSYTLLANFSCACNTGNNVSSLSSSCVNCSISNCIECNLNNKCVKCVGGYTVSSLNGNCVVCSDPKCKYCDTDNVCGECFPNRNVHPITKLCIMCYQRYCLKCDVENECAVCSEGFTLYLGRQCICKTGKSIIDNKCVFVQQSSTLQVFVLIFCLFVFVIILIYYVAKGIIKLKNNNLNEKRGDSEEAKEDHRLKEQSEGEKID